MNRLFCALLLFLWGILPLWAVTASDVCPDFANLRASYVEPYASGMGNVLVTGRHTVITKQGTDPRTGGKLKLLPEGVDKVIRLGDEFGGTQNESLSYHVIPSRDANLFRIKFAVVFENPNHILKEQPYFSISVTDAKGNLLPKTFSYNVYANNELKGFEEYNSGKTSIMWRDWTDVVVDLTHYIGQEVVIKFYTRDCLQNGHFAYAYLSATCTSNFATMEFCDGNSAILSLLSSFVSYLWSDGTESNKYEGSLNQPLWCDVTSITGEISRIFVSLADKSAPTKDHVKDVVCQGAEYYWNGNYINTDFEGTRVFYGLEANTEECSLSDKMLELTTIPAFSIFNERICEGESYMKNGFSFKTPPVGYFIDTIEVATQDGCRHWNVLNLSVVPKNISPSIEGTETPCTETVIDYYVNGNYDCQWTLPKNAELMEGNLTSASVEVRLSNAEKGVISVVCSNGCVSKTASMSLSPIKAHRSYSIDTICQGTTYEKNGWILGVQTQLGYSTHIKHLGDICDGTEVLVLYVQESPAIGVRSSADVVCPGNEAELTAVDNRYESTGDVAIGDVVCEDGSILKLKEFLKSGKKAKGVVFAIKESWAGTMVHSISIVDEYAGEAKPYDISTMDDNPNIVDLDLAYDIIRKWLVLNKYLHQINGADLLEGCYWTNYQASGTQDTHRYRFCYDDYRNYSIDNACKTRYCYKTLIR